MGIQPNDRTDHGLQETFKSVFPIGDFAGRSVLEFVSYDLESPKYDVEECQQRGLTYASPLRVTLRLVVWEENEDTGLRSIRDIKEQDVYMGDMPLMTSNGTFIVNGTERVIVSQMHRSPGVFFDHDRGKTHASGKFLFASRVISAYRGSWLDFEFDAKDILNVRIDRKRKLPATTFMMALPDVESEDYIEKCLKKDEEIDPIQITGMSREEILSHFYKTVTYNRKGDGWQYDFNVDALKGSKLVRDLIDAKTKEVIATAGSKMTPRSLKKLADSGIKAIFVSDNDLLGRFVASDIFNTSTGEVYVEAGDELNEDVLNRLNSAGVKDINLLFIDNVNFGPHLRNTLAADRNTCRERGAGRHI